MFSATLLTLVYLPAILAAPAPIPDFTKIVPVAAVSSKKPSKAVLPGCIFPEGGNNNPFWHIQSRKGYIHATGTDYESELYPPSISLDSAITQCAKLASWYRKQVANIIERTDNGETTYECIATDMASAEAGLTVEAEGVTGSHLYMSGTPGSCSIQ